MRQKSSKKFLLKKYLTEWKNVWDKNHQKKNIWQKKKIHCENFVKKMIEKICLNKSLKYFLSRNKKKNIILKKFWISIKNFFLNLYA